MYELSKLIFIEKKNQFRLENNFFTFNVVQILILCEINHRMKIKKYYRFLIHENAM